MIRVRRASERGHFDHGWLDTYHTFSFAHEDMEIVTYVLSGALAHRDSLGTGSTIRPGGLQRMTAGTGITHSEFNPSEGEPVHLCQIWLRPEREGLEPSYERKAFPEDRRHNRLRLVASPDGGDGSLAIRQDARLYLATLDDGREVAHALAPGRHAWVQVLRGSVALNVAALSAGDGAALSDEPGLAVRADGPSEVLVFDLA